MTDTTFSEAHLETFRAEVSELLQDLEEALLELESSPDDPEGVGRVFRGMHTIKGAAAMFGYAEVTRFTHEVENAFDEVRAGRRKIDKELINLSLQIRDYVRVAVLDLADPDALLATEALLKAEIDAFFQVEASQNAEDRATAAPARSKASLCTYRIRFMPPLEVFHDGTKPLRLIESLTELGPAKVVSQPARIPRFAELNPEYCYLSWDIILSTDKPESAIEEVFEFVSEDAILEIDLIDDGDLFEDDGYKMLGDILVERGDVRREDLERLLSSQPRFGEMLTKAGVADPARVASALAEQAHVRQVRKRRKPDASASLRVPTEKLDGLVDLVGELVIAEARLSELASLREDPELRSVAEELERLSADLRDSAMSLRMLPIGSTFTRFRRLVRDLSEELHKEVHLETEGGETALDKGVIEGLGEPLVHIIRNAIDHGIESPEQREALGKPRVGSLQLKARQSEANVILTIRDDGQGLDVERIRAKAVAQGLIAEDAELSPDAIYPLICAAGLSTAEQVSQVSGRGVGMDAVEAFVKGHQGSLRVASEPGQGTEVTIVLPLSLAIVEGLLVRLQDSAYVLPLALVEECIEATPESTKEHGYASLIELRGQLVPYVRLREWFGVRGDPPGIEQVVVTQFEGSRFGFVVDQVVGQHQTVIKSLGRLYEAIEGISGATVLGDGSLALILDVPKLAAAVAGESTWRSRSARPFKGSRTGAPGSSGRSARA